MVTFEVDNFTTVAPGHRKAFGLMQQLTFFWRLRGVWGKCENTWLQLSGSALTGPGTSLPHWTMGKQNFAGLTFSRAQKVGSYNQLHLCNRPQLVLNQLTPVSASDRPQALLASDNSKAVRESTDSQPTKSFFAQVQCVVMMADFILSRWCTYVKIVEFLICLSCSSNCPWKRSVCWISPMDEVKVVQDDNIWFVRPWHRCIRGCVKSRPPSQICIGNTVEPFSVCCTWSGKSFHT